MESSDDELFEELTLPSLSSYPNDPESSEDERENVPAKSSRGRDYKYSILMQFGTKAEYDAWWSTEKKNWTFHSRTQKKFELAETWFCKFAGKYSERQGVNCKSRLRHFFPDGANSVTVMKCENEHEHERSVEPAGLPDPLKKRVLEMSNQGLPPKRIHITFQNEKIVPLPRLEQIQWLVNRNRTANCEPFTDLQLREYCEGNSAEPEDEDKWFVLAYEIESPETFFVIWTTKKLLKRQLSAEQIQCDATSSTNWHNYPLIVVGHSDHRSLCFAYQVLLFKA